MSVNGSAGSSSPVVPSTSKVGVWGQSDTGIGVAGTSLQYNGVEGDSSNGVGVTGTSGESTGVIGICTKQKGVYSGKEIGVHGRSELQGGIGVLGEENQSSGIGVRGIADNDGIGVWGSSNTFVGVNGEGKLVGCQGISATQMGVYGASNGNDAGVLGSSASKVGVYGYCRPGYGVSGVGGDIGVYALCTNSNNTAYLGAPSVAGDFYNDIYVHGKVTKFGGGFQIDHPLDPANKYFSHSFVESEDMKNIYDGVVTLDRNGNAEVKFPKWFEEVNNDFRYQLTAVGAPGPNLYIEEEISNNSFKIAGGKHGMKVSWQVTGIRKDPWANTNRVKVEQEKPAKARGYYLNPDLYNQPAERSIQWARYPEQMQRVKQDIKRIEELGERLRTKRE